jgi:hypothetical protein
VHHNNYLTSALPRDFRSAEPLNKSCLHFASTSAIRTGRFDGTLSLRSGKVPLCQSVRVTPEKAIVRVFRKKARQMHGGRA